MAWSTRELAELAGVSIKTVRHYHTVGLLDEPERAANGYKQYRTAHLVRLLQVRRLNELGVPLAEIAGFQPGDDRLTTTIEALDTQLEAEIARLQRVRGELAEAITHGAAMEVPSGFGAVADQLSAADRSLLTVLSRVFSADALADVARYVEERSPVDHEFDALSPDATADTIADLAERMAPNARRFRDDHPWMTNPLAHSEQRPHLVASAIVDSLAEIYNRAQVAVLQRVNEINDAFPPEVSDTSLT